MIDWRVDLAKWKPLQLRVGQWKIDYNRERVDSSGRQQFVERSIVNRIFTIDRQVGVSLRGHLFEGTPADLRYYVGAFTGEGRGVTNDDNNLMYAGRLQWNFLGRDLALRQTDVERTELPTASLAFGGATHKGVCTRWSSSGCGELDGFASPRRRRNRTVQGPSGRAGVRLQVAGFLPSNRSFHFKRVIDRLANTESDLYGAYAQAGYFFHELVDCIPEPLELAFRYAYVREPNETTRSLNNRRQEFTAGAKLVLCGAQQQAHPRLLSSEAQGPHAGTECLRQPRALPVGHFVLIQRASGGSAKNATLQPPREWLKAFTRKAGPSGASVRTMSYSWLLPTANTALRRSLPRVVAEIEDTALMKVFGQHGTGLFAAPSAVEDEIREMHRVHVVGRTKEVREEFYAITVERRISSPAIAAIAEAARTGLLQE